MTTPLTELTNQPAEREGLVEFLEYYRAVIRRKAEGLTAAELARRLPPSTLTLGGLLKHLAAAEADWFVYFATATEPGEPWASVDWKKDPDWELTSAADDSPEELFALYDAACEKSRQILATFDDLDAVLAAGGQASERKNMRWLLIHMIEEYARHAGHADLIRESTDGATGD